MSMSCFGYKLSRRSMLKASVGTFLGLQVRDLVALAGTSHAATAEHVILFWHGGGMSHSGMSHGGMSHGEAGAPPPPVN